MVVTGASSGIGLVTARRAARKGTRLVLAARSEDALRRLTAEIRGNGGLANSVVADVSREEDVRRIAQVAQERFSGFDTWVNNAGVSMYGELTEVSVEDMRRLFEINLWGLIILSYLPEPRCHETRPDIERVSSLCLQSERSLN